MSECSGFFGRMFGHKYVSKLVDYKMPELSGITFSGWGSTVSSVLDQMAQKRYNIVCKRCGKEIHQPVVKLKGFKHFIDHEGKVWKYLHTSDITKLKDHKYPAGSLVYLNSGHIEIYIPNNFERVV